MISASHFRPAQLSIVPAERLQVAVALESDQ